MISQPVFFARIYLVMLKKNLEIISKYYQPLLFTAVFLVFVLLRFVNLGFSEYIPDETTVMTPVRDSTINSDFLLMQRKGPVQFVAAQFMRLLGFSVYDEFAFRLPFFIASVLGLYFYYKFLQNLEGRFVALVATLFLGLNGLMVAFGRVVQYQSFNLLFSFAGLYFLSLLKNSQNRIRNSMLGSLFLCLSLLSHWDVVFVFAPAAVLVFKYVLFGDMRKRAKYSSIGAMSLPIIVVLFPFIMNYANNALTDSSNLEYFQGRVSLTEFSIERIMRKLQNYTEKVQLYNPFVYLYSIGILAFAGAVGSKRSFPYFYWFLLTLGIFLLFVEKPGTHVYNFLYPLSVLAAFGAYYFYQLFKGYLSKAVVVSLAALFLFFAYQDYLLFVDVKVDYPWSQEKILGHKTRDYSAKNLPNNIIGFPIYRGWEKAAEFLSGENAREGRDIPYITNEESSISGFYLDLKYGRGDEYYAIGVKRPLTFVYDYTFPSIKNKKTIKRIEANGENTMRIYKVVTINEQ
ncbi:MAG: hypothetical protein KatS3mg101_0708 [Patescibacteria group bacterium]|nr:MAG: hypothetical protein KatS3mg101_0708 [Patescibacteria group bacterium]